MLYAKIVLGLPVEGPFDYIVPEYLTQKIKVGMRVVVSFGTRRVFGYVVKLSRKTKVKNLKAISELIDASPVLDKNMLLLTKELSDYYCCSWGEAIETALPEALRKGKTIPYIKEGGYSKPKDIQEAVLIHDLTKDKRWDVYLKYIKEALNNNRSIIFLSTDIHSTSRAREKIDAGLGIRPLLLYRKQPKELDEWLKIKRQEVNIVVGTRSAIFAPLNNLGLIIIDGEEGPVYKQDQVPHYNAREAAFMRVDIQKAKLILGSSAPSLEALYLIQKNKIKYTLLPRKTSFPEIKIVNTAYENRNKKTKNILSRYTLDSIIAGLNTKAKILLFLNRRGFATFASCHNCGSILKCPRCNISLVYYFKDNILGCRYCNFKMQPPDICPACNAGYIKYSGVGTEKIESELSRLLPQARIKRWDDSKGMDIKDTDILISTQHIIKETGLSFDLIVVMAIDTSLNRIDFRSAEKTFGLLVGLSGLTDKKIIIQTHLARHHCFKALEQKDVNAFYHEELEQRRQLKFPPYRHLGLVKLRGKSEARTRDLSDTLFKRLYEYKPKDVEVIAVNPGQPAKLRGNFYWQILLRSGTAQKLSKFLKIYLKDFSHSGIIVTVDIDPI